MRALFIFLLFVITPGCRRPAAPAASPTGQLKAADYAALKAVNDQQAQALRTVARLVAGQKASCAMDRGGRSVANLDGWSTRAKVEPSDSCPLRFVDQWTFNPVKQTLDYQHELKAQRNLGVLNRRARGQLSRTGAGSVHQISGGIRFEPMLITGVGPVEIWITTDQNYAAARGMGEIRVIIQHPEWTHEGRVRWRVGPNPSTIYEVDGHAITKEGFDALFSSYGTAEIMANSMKMR